MNSEVKKIREKLIQLKMDSEQVKEINGGKIPEEVLDILTKEAAEYIEELKKKAREIPNYSGLSGDGDVSHNYNGVDLRGNKYAHLVEEIKSKGYADDGVNKITTSDLYIAHQIMLGASQYRKSKKPSQDLVHSIKALANPYRMNKFLNSQTAGEGLEWMNEAVAPMLLRDIHQETRLLSMLPANNIIPNMPAESYKMPEYAGKVKWTNGTEGVEAPRQVVTTSRNVIDTNLIQARLGWSITLEEAAAFNMAVQLRSELQLSAPEIMEDFLINADGNVATGNINHKETAPPSSAFYLANGQDGLRAHALLDFGSTDNDVNAAGALTDALMGKAIAALDKYYSQNNTVIVTNIRTWIKDISLLSSAFTVDKYGAGAAVRSGAIQTYMGLPIIVSSAYPLTDTDGKVSTTPATNTKGGMVIFDTRSVYVGFMSGLQIELVKNSYTQLMELIANMRMGVGIFDRTNTSSTSIIRNITA